MHILQRNSVVNKVGLAVIMMVRLTVCYLIRWGHFYSGALKNSLIYLQKSSNNMIKLQLA